jgi:hypothetical protein
MAATNSGDGCDQGRRWLLPTATDIAARASAVAANFLVPLMHFIAFFLPMQQILGRSFVAYFSPFDATPQSGCSKIYFS